MRHRLSLIGWMAILSFFVFIPFSGWGAVDVDDVAGPWDGKSIATALKTVQEGLHVAAADNRESVRNTDQARRLGERRRRDGRGGRRSGRRGWRDRGREIGDREVGLIQNEEGSFKGYTLLAPIMSTATYLLDNDGRVVNKWESDSPGLSSYLLENGHLLRTASSGFGGPFGGNRTFHGGGAGGRVQEFEWDGTLVWDFEYSSDEHLLHHDIEPLPNGNVLMIAWERKTAEEAIAAGRAPEVQGDGDLWVDHVIEVKPTGKTSGEIVWEWHVWDHLIQDADPSKANYGDIADHPELININPLDWVAQLSPKELEKLRSLGYVGPAMVPNARRGRTNPDWNHTNAISYNPELDQIALTVLGLNEIWIIDHSTTTREAAGHTGGRSGKGGDLLYRWGNPEAYRARTVEDQQLFAQHDANWIPRGLRGAGNLLVFNNGRGRPDGNYSSVDEIVLPVDGQGKYAYEPGTAFGPAKPAWSYTAPEKSDFYSGHISGAQRLPNENTLICSGANGTIFEVTRKDEVVWEYVSPVGGGPGPGGFGPGMFGPGMGGGRPGAPPDLDSDGDGLLTYKEASGLPFMNEELFKRLDANGDEVLSQEELARGAPPGMPGPGMPGPGGFGPPGMPGPGGFGPPGMVSRLDSDGDGAVTYEEASVLPFMSEDVFKELDTNGNETLSEEELSSGPPPGMFGPGMPGPGGFGPPGMPGPGGFGPRGMLSRLDSDGDGAVTYEEASVLPFMSEDVFKQLDTNGDEALSEEELSSGPPPGMPGPGMGGPFGGLFRAYRYAPNYAGLSGKDLTPGKTLEELISAETNTPNSSEELGVGP